MSKKNNDIASISYHPDRKSKRTDRVRTAALMLSFRFNVNSCIYTLIIFRRTNTLKVICWEPGHWIRHDATSEDK